MICNRCGKVNDDAANFCIGCGAPLGASESQSSAAASASEPTAQFCGWCGRETIPGGAACTSCGAPGGQGVAFCRYCGRILTPGAVTCPNCNTAVPQPRQQTYAYTGQNPPQGTVPPQVHAPSQRAVPPQGYVPPQNVYASQPPVYGAPSPYGAYPPGVQKNKVVAGLLGIFLGGLGVHNFYLGYTSKAIVQLVITIAGYLLFFLVLPPLAACAMGIWGFVEGILILTGRIAVDGHGVPLQQ